MGDERRPRGRPRVVDDETCIEITIRVPASWRPLIDAIGQPIAETAREALAARLGLDYRPSRKR